jgi:hypothetical protein
MLGLNASKVTVRESSTHGTKSVVKAAVNAKSEVPDGSPNRI